MPSLPIAIRTLRSRHCLIIRSRIPEGLVEETIRSSIKRVRTHATRVDGVLVGTPFTRYPMTSGKLVTIEVGMEVETPVEGIGEIEAAMLRGGRVAVAVHAESRARLPDTYAAMKSWLAGHGEVPGDAPWESHGTDPVEQADPENWRIEIFQPLR
jgi:effector-binding domain-containing protein